MAEAPFCSGGLEVERGGAPEPRAGIRPCMPEEMAPTAEPLEEGTSPLEGRKSPLSASQFASSLFPTGSEDELAGDVTPGRCIAREIEPREMWAP